MECQVCFSEVSEDGEVSSVLGTVGRYQNGRPVRNATGSSVVCAAIRSVTPAAGIQAADIVTVVSSDTTSIAI